MHNISPINNRTEWKEFEWYVFFFFSSLKTSQILNDVAHKLAKVAELEGQLRACFYFSTQPVPAILERGIKNKSVVLNNTWSNIFEADSHK